MTDKGVVYKLVLPPLTTPQIHLDGLALLFPESTTSSVADSLISAGYVLASAGIKIDTDKRIEERKFSSRAAMRGREVVTIEDAELDNRPDQITEYALAEERREHRWIAGLDALSSAVASLSDEDFAGWLAMASAVTLIKNHIAADAAISDSDV